MLKAFGFSLIVLSGILFSMKTHALYQQRIEELEAFLDAIKLCKTEMLYLKTPVFEIFSKIEDCKHPMVKQFFHFLSAEVQSGKSLKEIWNSALSKYEVFFHLKEKDIKILSDFSVLLGQTDLANQLNNIDHVTERLTVQLANAQKEKEKDAKPKGTLYISAAFVIGILLL